MYETILSPVEIGGLTLKNRIVFAPTSLGLRGEELEQKITAIAEGGCAMIIIGDVPDVYKRQPRTIESMPQVTLYKCSRAFFP